MSCRRHIHNVLAVVMGSKNVSQLFQGNLRVKVLKLECSAQLHNSDMILNSIGVEEGHRDLTDGSLT